MADERFLVTGALGCIGAWVVRNLVREGVPVTIFDPGGSLHRLRLIMSDDELNALPIIGSDISDLAAVESAVKDSGATRIIHLAGLQVPMCKADPALGARVNVVGTVNVFEAAKRAGINHVVYASSIAVYGLSEDYPEGALAHDAALKPRTHYGVYKQANEGTARIYWLDEGISSIGLRPYIVYGPGRDQGLTSAPTKAMLAAASGEPYHIAYGGRSMYQYADDTARIFIRAARAAAQNAEAYNLRGSVVRMSDIVAAIERAVPGIAGQITFDDKQLPFPEEMEDKTLMSLLGDLAYTSLDEGVAETIRIFQHAIAAGHLRVN
ncbi:MAG: SDR family oxidoreductase [Anaerolineae bacterium]|nr:SDR family oxidoreductase [Anaerolineae bacterium]